MKTLSDYGAEAPATATRKSSGKAADAKTSSLRIERADNGGFSISQDFRAPMSDGPWPRSKTHVFADAGSMVAFVEKVFGEDTDKS